MQLGCPVLIGPFGSLYRLHTCAWHHLLCRGNTAAIGLPGERSRDVVSKIGSGVLITKAPDACLRRLGASLPSQSPILEFRHRHPLRPDDDVEIRSLLRAASR